MKNQNKIKVGDKVKCLRYGKNNSEVFAGQEYIVSEHEEGMIKLVGHPDWWSAYRFEIIK
jgi:hypothetical protein